MATGVGLSHAHGSGYHHAHHFADPRDPRQAELAHGPPNARLYVNPPFKDTGGPAWGKCSAWAEGPPPSRSGRDPWEEAGPGPEVEVPILGPAFDVHRWGLMPPHWPPPRKGQSSLTWRLPDAHRLYRYGPRRVTWSPEVPVAEQNHGIMINAEFAMQPGQLGQEVVFDDWAVRNSRWRHLGAMIPRKQPSLADKFGGHMPDYDLAHDLKNHRHMPHFVHLLKHRQAESLDQFAERRFDREVLNQEELRDFFADDEKIRSDALEG